LKREFGVDLYVGKNLFSNTETISQTATVSKEYSQLVACTEQTLTLGLKVEPFSDGDFEFATELAEGADKEMVKAVEEGVRSALSGGDMSGFPMTQIKVTLTKLVFSEEHATPLAATTAGSLFFREACRDAAPIVLEPVMRLDIVVPDEFCGTVINDVNTRRGTVKGVDVEGLRQSIHAVVPLASMIGYATQLRSITQGRAVYTMSFSHYGSCDKQMTETILRSIGRIY
jgi:elongation factor G